jgi:hypothetical protein
LGRAKIKPSDELVRFQRNRPRPVRVKEKGGGHMKWYVIVDKYIDGRECVGINDESYYGDGDIISTHTMDDEADSAAREYAQASGLPLLADIEQEAI